MFNPISDLSQVLRKEWPIEPAGSFILMSGVSGSWVTIDSNGNAELTTTSTQLAWPIWNESSRDGSLGAFTPDVLTSKRVSVIVGKIFATTDQYTGNPVRGNILKTGALGKLAVATQGTDPAVAMCVNPPYQISYFGTTINVIDIQVL